MKIALLQLDIRWEDKQANRSYYKEKMQELPADVDMVVLPEMFTTGFSMHPGALAEETEGPTLQWMREISGKYGFAVTGSAIIKAHNQYYNRLFFVCPDGSFQTYDKRHLFSMGEEHLHYTAGTRRLIVSYKGWRICPLICYDLRFPVWSRNYGEVYDLLLYVANWPAVRIAAWDNLLIARAIENQCYVAGINRYGADGGGMSHNGHSQLVDFRGIRLNDVAADGEKIIIADLSMDSLTAFRQKFPVNGDADNFKLAL